MKKMVVVTGGTSGLGLELTKLFSQAGYSVLVLARTQKEELENVMYEYGSIADESFVKKVYEKYSKHYCIEYLINNAACGSFGTPETNTLEKINSVLEAGLVGLILNTTYALPLLDPSGAKIINVLSTAALRGNVNESLYCAQKWGARGYTESLKATFKGTKIKVVSVSPGGMNTDFWENNRDYVPKDKSEKWMKAVDVAKVLYDNITNKNLCVSDIVIERV